MQQPNSDSTCRRVSGEHPAERHRLEPNVHQVFRVNPNVNKQSSASNECLFDFEDLNAPSALVALVRFAKSSYYDKAQKPREEAVIKDLIKELKSRRTVSRRSY